jgi:hypothetical protein
MSAPAFTPPVVPSPPYVPSLWYPTAGFVNSGGLATGTGLVRLYPFQLRAPITVSDLGARIVIAGGGSFQLAIYASNPATGRPAGGVLARTADILTTSIATVEADITGANVTLSAGPVYWAATNVDASSTAATFQTPAISTTLVTALAGAVSLATVTVPATGTLLTLTTPMAYNTWSTMTGATFTEVAGFTGAAHIWLKAA